MLEVGKNKGDDLKKKTFLWICIYTLLPLLLNFFYTQHSQLVKKFANVFVDWAALLLPLFIFPKAAKRYMWIFFLLYPLYWVNICHGILFGGSLSSISFQTVFDSNPAEILDFIGNFFNVDILLATLLLFVSGLYILLKKAAPLELNRRARLIGLIVCALFFVIMFYQALRPKYRILPVKMVTEYLTYRNDLRRIIEIKNSRSIEPFADIVSSVPADEPQTYVVVIGESVDRGHLNLYGYHRNTMPKLTSYADELYIFRNVYSPHSHTLSSLRKVLTFAHDEELTDAYDRGSIINYFNDAGFKTFWLSNQYSMGDNDNVIAVYGEDAKRVEFTNTMNWQEMESEYDEVLLPLVEKALQDKAERKIVFVHLMGSHGRYENRYPKHFRRFYDYETARQKKVCHYDNSIVYTDYVLNKIIKQLRKTGQYAYLLYFSDHGEDVYDRDDSCFCHSEDIASRHMFEIPFILWLSERYKRLNPALAERLPDYAGRLFNTQNLIHSLPTLSGLDNPDIKPELNLFAPEYDVGKVKRPPIKKHR